MGCKMEICTPDYLQSNGMAKRMMKNLVKIMHAAIAEGRKLKDGKVYKDKSSRSSHNMDSGG